MKIVIDIILILLGAFLDISGLWATTVGSEYAVTGAIVGIIVGLIMLGFGIKLVKS